MSKFEDMIKEAYGTLGGDTEEKPGDDNLDKGEDASFRKAAEGGDDEEAKDIVKKLDDKAEKLKSDAQAELKK